MRKSQVVKGTSFEDWCVKNNRQDVLNRWDYELNEGKPNQISSGTNNKFYFKCPIGLHKSELKCISNFTNGQEGSIKCNQCNSFAQWGIDNICEDFLENYWDYDMNTINPWEISYSSHNEVWIKCQEKDYHGSYKTNCAVFIKSGGCPYCRNYHGKVHPLDSLGKYLEDNNLLHLWSDKNNKSPYEYSPRSQQKAWWRCPFKKHKDFLRSIYNSNVCNFRCPECNFSKGEERISNYLISKNIKYIPQKTYDGLVGLNNGLLSYDFYLPKYNTLIEYQGEQHEKYIKGFRQSKKEFKKQIEHDRRKRQYSELNNYNFLEIWYYDFNRIEEILNNELNIND